jgi:hypothetical protein
VIRTVIVPTEVFDREAAERALNLSKSTLAREIREGRLRYSRRAGRLWFLGSWLLSWIEAGGRQQQPAAAGVSDNAE